MQTYKDFVQIASKTNYAISCIKFDLFVLNYWVIHCWRFSDMQQLHLLKTKVHLMRIRQ